MSLLEVSDLNVFYGRLHAVHGITFRVDTGRIVTLLGANGAGKSSTLRAVCGLVRATGRIVHDGVPIERLAAERRVARGIATVQEGRALFRSLTVEENLLTGAYLRRDRGAVRSDLAHVYEIFPRLLDKRRALAATLSGGQGQMLAIGRALMSAPRLLLLDEPSHGLAPNLVDELFALLPRLQAERGLTILLVEQNANKALTVASYGYVLESGTLALEGPTADLAHDPRVAALYLGGSVE